MNSSNERQIQAAGRGPGKRPPTPLVERTAPKGHAKRKRLPSEGNGRSNDDDESGGSEVSDSNESGASSQPSISTSGSGPASGVHPARLLQMRKASSTSAAANPAGVSPARQHHALGQVPHGVPPPVMKQRVMLPPFANSQAAISNAAILRSANENFSSPYHPSQHRVVQVASSQVQRPVPMIASVKRKKSKSSIEVQNSVPSQEQPIDERGVYDTLGQAGLDMKHERYQLANETQIDVDDSMRTMSRREVESEQYYVSLPAIRNRLRVFVKRGGLDMFSSSAARYLALALQDRLKNVMSDLISISKRRIDLEKDTCKYRTTNEPKVVLRKVQREEEERKRQAERDEQERLRRDYLNKKAKEDADEATRRELDLLEQQESNFRSLSNANDAAMRAMGSSGADFLFQKSNRPKSTSSAILPSAGAASFLPPSALQTRFSKGQNRRITLADLLFFLEREQPSCKSALIYECYGNFGIPGHASAELNPTVSGEDNDV